MGYCARDGSGDGKASYFPRVSGTVLPHVADANARLSLYYDSVVVSGAGSTDANSVYTQRGQNDGKPVFNQANSPSDNDNSVIKWVSGPDEWRIQSPTGGVVYRSTDTVASPWLVTTWILVNGSNPLPTLTHSPGQVTGAGFQCTQDDESNLIVHTFNGDGADADAGLWVSGAGTDIWNGAFYYDSDAQRYYKVDDAGTRFDHGALVWLAGTDYVGDTSTYAWQTVSWEIGSGDSPAPTVQRNPIASLANWTP